MKKVLIVVLTVVVAVGVLGFLFREPLMQSVADRLTADMFVESDADSYDPGIPVGARLPVIAARYDGRTVESLREFMGENGLVVFAVRSVDW